MKEYKDYEYEDLKMPNAIITPAGRYVHIEHQSHQYFLEKLLKDELNMSRRDIYDKLSELMYSNKYTNRVTMTDVILVEYGFISIHSSGMGYGWIQGPNVINEWQINAVKSEYVLGRIPSLLMDIINAWNDPEQYWNSTAYDELYKDIPNDRYSARQFNVVNTTDSTHGESRRRGYRVDVTF